MSRPQPANSSLSIADVMRGMFRRLPMLLTLVSLGLLGGFLFLMANKPAYLAEAQVIVENLATPYDRTTAVQDQASASPPVDERMVTSQISVLKSKDIASRVVDQLSLDTKPEYNAQLRERSTAGKYLTALGLKDDPKRYAPKDLAAETLQDQTNIFPVPTSNVIGIKSTSGDPVLAAATANALAETYVLSTHEIFASSTDRARSWLSKEIADLRAKVSTSENTVEKYRSEAGLLKGATSTLSTQQISELNSQLTLAETAATEASARAAEINNLLKSTGTVDAFSDVLSSPVIQGLRTQQANAQRKVSELSATYLPNHPKMMAAQKELAAVSSLVRIEALKVIDALTGQAKVALARSDTLRGKLEDLKSSESQANFSDVKLKALQREADANRSLLENLLSRYADASARQDSNLQPGFARIIQKATVPAVPYFPKTGPVLLLSGLAGLALGLGLAFVLEVLSQSAAADDAMANAELRHHATQKSELKALSIPELGLGDLEIADQPPVPPPTVASASILSVMPAAITAQAARQWLSEEGQGRSRLGDAAHRVAVSLKGLKQKLGSSSVAFTSLGSSAPNAALTAIAVARDLAAQGDKVIAVDIANGTAGFESLLGIGRGVGLGELIKGKADFMKIVGRDPASKLHVIRVGDLADVQSQDMLAQRLPSIVRALQQIYSFVLLHGGEATAATAGLIKAANAVVLLAPQSRLQDAAEAAKALEADGKTRALLLKLDPQATALQPGAASA